MIGFITQIFHPRQFLRPHLRSNLFHDFRWRHLVWQCSDYDIGVFFNVGGAGAHTATTGFIHGLQVASGRYDFGSGWIIRAPYMLTQIFYAGVRVVQQAYAGTHNFVQIMGWNIGRHTNGNAGGAIQ